MNLAKDSGLLTASDLLPAWLLVAGTHICKLLLVPVITPAEEAAHVCKNVRLSKDLNLQAA